MYNYCKIKSTFKEDDIQIYKIGRCRVRVNDDQTTGILEIITKQEKIYFDKNVYDLSTNHMVRNIFKKLK